MSLDDLQAQLRGALDQQFAALKSHYENAIAEARQEARADAEHELRAKLVSARAEWEEQLNAQVAAVRAEAERAAAAAAQVRAELEQARDQAVASARRDAEVAVAAERQRVARDLETERERSKSILEQAKTAIETERRRGQSEAEAVRAQLQSEIASAREAAAREAAAAAATKATFATRVSAAAAGPAPSSAMYDRVATGIRTLDTTNTLGGSLDALVASAGAIAGRAALFLINGDRLKAWKSVSIPDIDVQTVESSIGGRDLLARAIQAGHATASGPALPAPPFARLPPERPGLAVPLMITGRAVAVLYVDGAAEGSSTSADWSGAVDLLVRHTSALLALRTAMRTFDMLRGVPPDADGNGNGSGDGGEGAARRFARLLVSEIKLYNEAAVRAGRQQRDLRRRLQTEIERAQRLYEERVPPAVSARDAYFHQELVQTLADGDASLLGN